MNLKKQYKVRTYKVRFFNGAEKLGEKNLTCIKPELWKYLKQWLATVKSEHPDYMPRFEFEEIVMHKPVTSYFLSSEKRSTISSLLKDVKTAYKNTKYTDPFAHHQVRLFSEHMWNSMQNEFYMTADICDNTIWHFQDEFHYFIENDIFTITFNAQPTEWTQLLNGWYNPLWVREVMKLVSNFNLDNQNPDYVAVFQNDFKKVKNEAEFCAAILKWTDLIYWHPEKLSLYDYTFQQPLNSHYDDEFNDDVKDDEENFDFYSQEVSND